MHLLYYFFTIIQYNIIYIIFNIAESEPRRNNIFFAIYFNTFDLELKMYRTGNKHLSFNFFFVCFLDYVLGVLIYVYPVYVNIRTAVLQ